MDFGLKTYSIKIMVFLVVRIDCSYTICVFRGL
jgi:hypothetical protein